MHQGSKPVPARRPVHASFREGWTDSSKAAPSTRQHPLLAERDFGATIGTWNRAGAIAKSSRHEPVVMRDTVFDFAQDVMSVYHKALADAGHNFDPLSSSSQQRRHRRKKRSANSAGATSAFPQSRLLNSVQDSAVIARAATTGYIVPPAAVAAGSSSNDVFVLRASREGPHLSWQSATPATTAATAWRDGSGVQLHEDDGPAERDDSGDEEGIAQRLLRRTVESGAGGPVELSRAEIALSFLGEKDPLRRTPGKSWGVLTHDQHGQRLLQDPALLGRPIFVMDRLPPPPEVEAAQERERAEQLRSMRWDWGVERGHEIPLTLLLLRGVQPIKVPDLVSYHMHPELLRDVAELHKGSYLSKFARRGGPAHERYFYLAMLPPSFGKAPVPMLVWKQHANAHTLLDRAPLSGLVGVSFNVEESPTFEHYMVLANGRPLKDVVAQQREHFMHGPLLQWHRRNATLLPSEREPEPLFEATLPPTEEIFLKGPVVGGGKHQYLFTRNAFTLWFLDRQSMTPSCIDLCAYDRPTASMWVNVLRSLAAINSIVLHSRTVDPSAGFGSPSSQRGAEGTRRGAMSNAQFTDADASAARHQGQAEDADDVENEIEDQAELLAWVRRQLHKAHHEGDPLFRGARHYS